MIENKSFNLNGEELRIRIGTYPNDRLGIICETLEEPYSDITINLPDKYIENIDEVFLDPLIKEFGLQDKLIQLGIIKEILCKEKYNYGYYELAKVDMEKLREYDPNGLKEFESNIEVRKHYPSI